MNVVILSPQFPPHIAHFCAALRARDVDVLGIGDEPSESLAEPLKASLSEYVYLPDMWEYEKLAAAVRSLIERRGPIHRLDSLTEHWLGHEGRLRSDFGITGLDDAQTRLQRSKRGMATLYRRAGIPCPAEHAVNSAEDLRDAATELGLPIVLKPDTGCGAAATFSIRTETELTEVAKRPLHNCVAQPFIKGQIVTYDGLTNAEGRILFATSHVYDEGIMEVLTGGLDGHYYSLRAIPEDLEALGRRAVAAFDVRERFFHQEFFREPNGNLVALEMNLRPPGGFSVDMMNYACNFDLYAIWAGVIGGDPWKNLTYERCFHTAHAGRRDGRRYRHSHNTVVAALKDSLMCHRPMPKAFSVTMGDDMFLLRHSSLASLQSAIHMVQAPAES